LQAAHTALGRDGKPLAVTHRDVAPDNVLLSRSGAVYLGDFGVARAAGCEDVAHRGEGPKGKRGYMAPEQARGGNVGPAADIFSLGRVIADAADLGCGPALREVIEQATADHPRDRFASASEMAAALLHACPPPSDPDRALAEWLHRYARDALVQTRGAASVLPRSDPPPAGKPVGNDVRRIEAAGPLFAAVPTPRRRALKIAAGGGALLFLLLPVVLLFAAPRRAHRFLQSAISAAPAPAHGDIRVTAWPGEAEVYLDGEFRGRTPLVVEVASGNHSVRVGSVKLGRWRAIDVAVKEGVEHRLDVDLSR
jgi:serine/threonine protein kinase